MNQIDARLRRYYRQISVILPCEKKMKKDILSRLQESVAEYRTQNPEADFSAVQAHFGSPEQIATGYVDNQDADALIKKLRIKKRVITVVAAVLAVVFVSWAAFMAWAAWDFHNSNISFVEVIITSH